MREANIKCMYVHMYVMPLFLFFLFFFSKRRKRDGNLSAHVFFCFYHGHHALQLLLLKEAAF